MDQAKTTQALKQIFDQCGTGILRDSHRFESVLMDVLPGDTYKTERMLFQTALHSSALPLLLRAPTVTPDAARRTVEQLQKDCFINEEAAKFIVRCAIAAWGGDAKVVDGAVPGYTPLHPAPEPVKPTPPAPFPEPYVPPEPPKPPEPYEVAAVYSKMFVPGRFFNTVPQGNLHMYQDRMLFLPNKGKGKVEMLYQDVYQIKTSAAVMFWWTLFSAAVPVVTALYLRQNLIIAPDSVAWLIFFLITAAAILSEYLIVRYSRRTLKLVMDYAIARSGNRYRPVHRIYIFSPADRKQAVSIVKSKMTAPS